MHARSARWLWVALPVLVYACSVRADPTGLSMPVQREVQIAAGRSADFQIDLPAETALDIDVQQLDEPVRVHLQSTQADAVTFRNEAGRMSRIRMTARAGQAQVWRIRIGALAPDRATRVRLRVAAPHAATPADRARSQAQRSLEEAEDLRRAVLGLEPGSAAFARMAELADARYASALAQARAAGDACAQAITNGDRARLYYATANYAQSAATAQLALGLRCGADADPAAAAERGVAERTLGSALGYLGRLMEGTAAQERALAAYRLTGDAYFQSMVMGNLSADYRALGMTYKALQSAREALRLAQANGMAQRALFAQESIGAIHLQRGELVPALDAYRKTLDALKATSYPMIAGMTWNDLGLLYGQFGQADEAMQAFRQAEAVWQQSGDPQGLAETQLNEADIALAANHVDVARAAFRRALDFDIAHQLQREQAHALGGLGRCALARGDFGAARERLTAARDLAARIGVASLQASALQALGDVAARQERWGEAGKNYAQAGAIATHTHDTAAQAAALAGHAHVLQKSGQLAEALALIERTLALVEDERAQIAQPQLATSYFSVQRNYYERAIDILMQLAQAQPGHGYAARALETAERARARSLQELLAQKTIHIEHAIDPALAQAELAAEDDLRRAARQLAQLPASAPLAEREKSQGGLDSADRALDEARGRIRAANPEYAELAHPAPLRAVQMQQMVGADGVALEYWLGSQHSYLWTVTAAAIRGHVLPPRADIETRARALRQHIAAPPAGADAGLGIAQLAARERERNALARHLADTLAQTILMPAAHAMAGAHHVAVVADGELQTLPLGMLDANAANRDFVQLPSLGTLRALRALSAPVTDNSVAVFADPVFRDDDPRLHHTVTLAASDDLPALPYARAEADAIAALATPATTRNVSGFDASRSTLVDHDWSRYAIVHFAAHAVLNMQHPQLSAIVLSRFDAQGHPMDGMLRMNDIYDLHLRANLVVLGACDTALGKSLGPEGLFSLSRAFFYAGTRRVVASLWPVDDRASAAFMRSFYTHLLRDHESAPAALRAAQADVRAQPRWAAPYYWAGFVVQGDWR